MSAHRVRVAAIKVRRDEFGRKYCKIEICRTVDGRDADTPAVAMAVAHMEANRKVSKLVLGKEIKSCSLTFHGAPTSEPSDRFSPVQAWNFRLKRLNDDEIALSFDFETSLEAAKRWLIGTIGDDVLCVIEDVQMSIGAA